MIDTKRTTVLTPHPRLSRWLLLQFANRQRDSGEKLWHTPEILPLNSWLQKLWVQSWPQHFILSNLQSKKLWEKIIRADKKLSSINPLHLQGTAGQAAKAYALIKEYRISLIPYAFGTAESEALLRWIKEYERCLAEWGAIDASHVLDSVKLANADKRIPLPESLILEGFNEITPQLQSWLDFLIERKVPVQVGLKNFASSDAPPQGNCELRRYIDQTEEAVQCARWVRNIFRHDSYSKDQTVGIIVPDLTAYRSVLKTELTAELTPSAVFPWLEVDSPFDISMGTPLELEPLINIALQILSIQNDSIPLPLFSAILSTPFLSGSQSESAPRRSLEMKLRTSNMVTVHLNQITEHKDKNQFPRLVSHIHLLQNHNRSKMQPSAWARDLSQMLKHIGWPGGDGGPSTYEKVVLENWRECLDDLASLDKIFGEIDRHKAVETLTQIAAEKQFQVKTREHPIQVISLSEANGMQFDHLWILGCHAEVLPAAPFPNPFIPPHLQKKNNLPHSSASRELQFAENILKQLIYSSTDSVISYPAQDTRNELRMSPLIRSFAKPCEFTTSQLSNRLKDQLQPFNRMEQWEDPSLLPLGTNELKSSGYKILKSQSDCPFQAFANFRLHTEKFATPEIDFNSSERGKLVHEVLHVFWKKVQTSANLRHLKEDNQLTSTLNTCIQEAIRSYRHKLSHQNKFTELECQRVKDLLLDWFDKELLRPEFEVVGTEKVEQIRIASLDLNIRIDRIDKNSNGHTILIDYKTGGIKTNEWFTDRLQEPQLPLYATKMTPDAIAYAEVKKGKSNNGLKLLARDNSIIPSQSAIDFTKTTQCPDWESLLTRWNIQLTSLAEEFITGKLEVTPFNIDETCRNCGLQTLCRIEERKPFLHENEEDI